MTHEHYWEVKLAHDREQYVLSATDRIVGKPPGLGQRKEYFHKDLETAVADAKAFFSIYQPPRCKCEPPKPRYYVITSDAREDEQVEGASLNYYPADGFLMFTKDDAISKGYRRSEWQSVTFK